MEIKFLNEYYSNYDEDGRLLSKHGQVEYLTTMKYIKKYLKKGIRMLDVGAGTGRYSLALASEGYEVDAVELIQHNVEILKSKIQPNDKLKCIQGNALDLSMFNDESFDITLVLGPMYHLYTEGEKLKALNEALRVTKKNGILFVAYCMNDATIIDYCFQKNMIHECLKNNMLTSDYHCISSPKDLFELVRIEDINRLNAQIQVERLHLIATDGATNYMRDTVNNMDNETYKIYLDYHFTICERQDLIGATHHSLDILRKK